MAEKPKATKNHKRVRRWYQNYLPFIARSPEMQIEWLVAEFHKQKLAREELTPYVRLLFSDENMGSEDELAELLSGLSPAMLEGFLQVADIYDVPKIIRLIPELNATLVELALTKELPPYESKPQQVMDKVLNAINDRSMEMLETVAAKLLANDSVPSHFPENYERFRAILEDKEFIRSLWPHAK